MPLEPQDASDVPLKPLWVRILFWSALLFVLCGLLWIGWRYEDSIARMKWLGWVARLSPALVALSFLGGKKRK